MKYNFDEVIDRGPNSLSYSIKWEGYSARFAGYDIDEKNALSMWVADMDFRSPQEVIDAIIRRAEHGIFGYQNEAANDRFREAAAAWYQRRYGWQPDQKWMLFSMGVIPAINATIQEFTQEGEGVIIQPPVYYPFAAGIRFNHRRARENRLIREDGRYTVDYASLERFAGEPGTKLMILCSPHNPVGRVWTRDELRRMIEICKENNVLVFADEIHADLIMGGNTFTTVGCLAADYDNLIIAHAPSKTFNLAGMTASLITVPNEALRSRLATRLYDANRIPKGGNSFGAIVGATAYACCDQYAEELATYIDGNMRYAEQYLLEQMPMLRFVRAEGTYFAWIDFQGTGLPDAEIYRKTLEEAKVIGDLGDWFGVGGEGFIRFNLACPRSLVEEMLRRLYTVFASSSRIFADGENNDAGY